MPFRTPYWKGFRPRTWTVYSGRTADTISEEMSVNRLVRPSSRTVRATNGRPAARAAAKPRRARSRATESWTWYIDQDGRCGTRDRPWPMVEVAQLRHVVEDRG